MIIMLATFVGLRQIYLFVMTHYIANTPRMVGLGYPVGWVSCCIMELVYYIVSIYYFFIYTRDSFCGLQISV